MKWLSTVKHADAGRLHVELMELDDSGFPQPTGGVEELEADSVMLALGQEVDLSLLDGVPGRRSATASSRSTPTMMTGHSGIFAGGDMVPAERTVITGIGHGKKAARNIDAWLRGAAYEPDSKHAVVEFDAPNPRYYADASHAVRSRLKAVRRASTFEEVEVSWSRLHDEGTPGSHHARVVTFLREHHVDAVVASHIGDGMVRLLDTMGLPVHLGAGDARADVQAVSREP